MSINSRQWPLFLSGAFISLECRRGTHRRSRSFASKGRSTCQTRKSGIGQRRPYCRPKNKPRPVHAAGASTGCCLNLWALVIRAVSGDGGCRPDWAIVLIPTLRPSERHVIAITHCRVCGLDGVGRVEGEQVVTALAPAGPRARPVTTLGKRSCSRSAYRHRRGDSRRTPSTSSSAASSHRLRARRGRTGMRLAPSFQLLLRAASSVKPPLRSKPLQCLRIVPELEIAAAFSISMT
jgi:hypothetical protein